MKKILCIDELDINLEILESILENDFHISFGRPSEEILIDNYDLMIINLCGKASCALLTKLGQNKLCLMPIIALSADSNKELWALQNGATDFIKKPFDPRVLKHRVLAQIGRKSINRFISRDMELKEN